MMIIPGELDAWAYDKRSVSLLRSGALAARCGRAAPCRMGPQQRCARQTSPENRCCTGTGQGAWAAQEFSLCCRAGVHRAQSRCLRIPAE